MRVVIALGGNALLRRGERPDARTQREHLDALARDLAQVAAQHDTIVVHGNGPQVGMLARESEDDRALSTPYPLGDLVAESQGLIGSWIEQELLNQQCDRAVALVTHVVVDPSDPAFDDPTKPIGEVYDEATAHRLATERSWDVRPDGDGWRRVVPSPQPLDVLELAAAERLVGDGYAVVIAGGGGVPVVRRGERVEPVEAVVDKDAIAALIADRIDADLLVIVTDVAGVFVGYGTPEAVLIRHATPDDLDDLELPRGSMGPKTTACSAFVTGGTGRRAAIGALSDLAGIVAGRAGTQVTRSRPAIAC